MKRINEAVLFTLCVLTRYRERIDLFSHFPLSIDGSHNRIFAANHTPMSPIDSPVNTAFFPLPSSANRECYTAS